MAKIAIIGGGVIGSSIAYYLALAGQAADVVVIEPDPTYEFAATPRATGGIRQLFTVPENIRMAQYGHEIYGQFETLMAVDGDPAPIDFHREGYLWLGSGRRDIDSLIGNWRIQTGSLISMSPASRLPGCGSSWANGWRPRASSTPPIAGAPICATSSA